MSKALTSGVKLRARECPAMEHLGDHYQQVTDVFTQRVTSEDHVVIFDRTLEVSTKALQILGNPYCAARARPRESKSLRKSRVTGVFIATIAGGYPKPKDYSRKVRLSHGYDF
jgi:hypothetical protein